MATADAVPMSREALTRHAATPGEGSEGEFDVQGGRMTTPTTRREFRERASDDVPANAPERRRSRVGGVVGEAILWIAAGAGLVCIVLVILAITANVSLIMFRTGSMEPTIPAGSVAVVQEVGATEIAVDDVVTVDRPGELPVTHRVTSIEDGASADERIITMRGDANEVEDPYPYEVTTVRAVLFSVPGLAPVIVAMSNPFVLGGITVAAALLVVWAFWPREKKDEES